MTQGIEIMGIVSSSPDNLPNNEPEFLVVQGRAAAGIHYVHIHLRSDVSGSLLAQEVVEVIPSSQSTEGTWGWRVEAADHGLILFCGRGFLVEAIGLNNASVALLDTMTSRTTNLVCKPPPANDQPGGSGTTVVSSPEESHLQALSEPDVNLSAHPAPTVPADGTKPALQCGNNPGWRRATLPIQWIERRRRPRNLLNFRIAHRANA